jgi:hypothetical protein
MKSKIHLLLLLVSLTYDYAMAQDIPSPPITSYHSRVLSDEKLKIYTDLALSGDLVAAEKITTHYCASGFDEKCFEWWRIYYENKPTKKSQRQLARILLFHADKDNKNLVRGIFWLKKSMNKNNPDDIAKLKEAEEALKSQRHFKATK